MRGKWQAQILLWDARFHSRGPHGLCICQRTIVAFCHPYVVQQAESFLHKLGTGSLLHLM